MLATAESGRAGDIRRLRRDLGIGHDYQGDMQLTGELWHPAKAIDPFVQCLGDQCQVIHNDFQLIIKKVK